jgi:glycolate oxidase iron-sulfur subunit
MREAGRTTLGLGLDPDDLAACVSCGLCLPHCPTYRVSGEEAYSPRGRIGAMRAVQDLGMDLTPRFVASIDTCVQCRGCETACPSGVPFGRLIEGTTTELARRGVNRAPWWMRLGLRGLGHHRLVLAGSSLLGLGQRLRLVPSSRFGLPRVPVRRAELRATGSDVWLFPGCVMDAWQRPVHQAVVDVLSRIGVGVALPGPGADCCGALHLHAGLEDEARDLGRRLLGAFPGTAPILVDSAGCGAALKDVGHLLGTPEAEAFSSRVRDVHEYLADHVDELPAPRREASWSGQVTIQDPCHLRHVQRAHLPVRTVLARYGRLRELDDEGLCCGAGGAYSVLHPDLARPIRDRKLAALERAGGTLVASANPGCSGFLGAAGVHVVHPVELLAQALAEQDETAPAATGPVSPGGAA